jgi:hypothetical protein
MNQRGDELSGFLQRLHVLLTRTGVDSCEFTIYRSLNRCTNIRNCFKGVGIIAHEQWTRISRTGCNRCRRAEIISCAFFYVNCEDISKAKKGTDNLSISGILEDHRIDKLSMRISEMIYLPAADLASLLLSLEI